MIKQTVISLLVAATIALPLHAADKVGVTSAVAPQANSYAGATLRQVRLGDNVVQDQRFETDAKGVVQILLVDGTSFTVGPRSSLVIDKFVYDPAKGTATLAASTTRGVMRFIGGAASKPGGKTTVKTPVGVAGIRGAVVDLSFPDAGVGEARVDMHYGDEVWFECLSGKTASLTQPGSSALITLEGNGCGQIVYRDDLPPLQPGTVNDAQTPPLQDQGVLADNPSGLAGFSGAPMEQELPRGGLGDDGSDDILPVAQASDLQDAVAGGGQLSGEFHGFLSGLDDLQSDEDGQYASPLSLGWVSLSVAPGSTFSANFRPEYWEGRELFLEGGAADFSAGLIDYAQDDGGMRQSSTVLCAGCKLAWGRWDGTNFAYNQELWGNFTDAYWIVGQQTNWADLPENIIVSYEGSAVGTLAHGGVIGEETGTLEASINFASGTGYLAISDFGGLNFSDDYLDIYQGGGDSSTVNFGGWMSSGELEAGGQYLASLGTDEEGDPVGTIFGSFQLEGWDESGEYFGASGVFAGKATDRYEAD